LVGVNGSSKRTLGPSLLAPLAAVALASGLVACGDDDDDSGDDAGSVTVEAAWVRQPAEGQTASAGYAVVTNTSDGEITLVGASTDDLSVDAVEIHETLMADDGTMSMQEREAGFTIAPGESLTLEPGGPHVMMLGIDPAALTDDIDLTLEFEGADPVTVTAELREIGADEEGEM
jgi:copper(I)-binding protein